MKQNVYQFELKKMNGFVSISLNAEIVTNDFIPEWSYWKLRTFCIILLIEFTAIPFVF